MGSGKSSVGQVLSLNNNLTYCDLDDYIENKENLAIPEIFHLKGEIYFRKIEHQYLKEVLSKNECDILSLGGGTPCYAGNMELINDHNVESYYLKVNLDILTKRLFEQRQGRPLIASIKTKIDLKDFIRKHLFEREYYYRQAKQTLNVSDLSIEEISNRIMNDLE